MNDSICAYCVNKDACEKCDKGWKDQFIPSDDVNKYFHKGYVGVRGINGCTYHFDNTREDLIETHSIRIHGTAYCPYCGEKMFHIQDKDTLITKGYCCICEGARAELSYEKEKKDLEEDYQRKLNRLQDAYREKLAFDIAKLREIKQKNEHITNVNHFSTINGDKCTDIDQIVW